MQCRALQLSSGDALTLIFTAPLWTLLLSRLFLGSRIGAWKVAFGVLLLAGMVLTVKVGGPAIKLEYELKLEQILSYKHKAP